MRKSTVKKTVTKAPVNKKETVKVETVAAVKTEEPKTEAVEAKAEEKAVEAMGNPENIGKKLNKIHRPKFDWKLGIVSLIPTVMGFFAMKKMMGKQMADDIGKYQNSLEVMNNEAVEYVRGMPVVKTFGQSVYTFKRFKNSIEDYEKFCMTYTKKARKPMIEFQVSVNCIFAFLIAVTLLVVGKGTVSQSFLLNLLFYIIYTPILTTTLTKVMFMSENTMLVTDCIKRINSIFEIKPLSENKTKEKIKDNSIELKNVKFKYDNAEDNAIDNISMKIKANSTIALVGPSGSGKSTVSKLCARFYDINKGKILIGGEDISKVDPEELLKRYSIVFQDVNLFDNTILENIRIGKKGATDEEVLKAAKEANCDEFVQKLPNGYNKVIGENGCNLSGGERQRLSIARALLKDTPIILLDEATASLDVENETVIQEAISKLIKNKTVLIIAHRMRTVTNADKIVVLKDGIVAEQGTPNGLINNGKIFKEMVQKQQSTEHWKL